MGKIHPIALLNYLETKMEKTIVYRVQDKEGRGPWRPGLSTKWSGPWRDDLGNLMPWYVEFGPLNLLVLRGEHSGSGCLTPEQLRRWFTEAEYYRLRMLGFKAVSLEADRILGSSNIQCFFARAKPLNEDVTDVDLYKEG